MDVRLPKEIQKKIFELTLAVYRVTDFFPHGEALRRHIREKANDVFGMSSEYSFSLAGEQDAVMILAKVESLKGYLNIARSLRYVRPINLTILEREYDHVAKFFSQELGKRDDLHTWDEFSKRQRESESVSDIKKNMSDKIGEIRPKTSATIVASPLPRPSAGIPATESGLGTAGGETSNKTRTIVSTNGMNDRQQKILGYIRQTSQAKISDFFTSFADISSKTIQRDLQDLVAKNILKKEGEKRWTIYSLVNK